MKLFLVSMCLAFCASVTFSQVLPKKTISLDEALANLQKEKDYQQMNEFYWLKFNSDLKPYYEVTFLNKNSKAITTISLDYYYLIGTSGYKGSRIYHKTIKPQAKVSFILNLNKEELKGYRVPSDFRSERITINTIRFADGTIDDFPVLLLKKAN